jgi:hypothetical protein
VDAPGFVSMPVEVDKERVLRLDFNVLCEAERASGINFLMDPNQSLSAMGLRAICWASWKRDDPSLSIEDVGLILTTHHLTVIEALTQAWLAALPDAEEGEGSEDPTEATAATQ